MAMKNVPSEPKTKRITAASARASAASDRGRRKVKPIEITAEHDNKTMSEHYVKEVVAGRIQDIGYLHPVEVEKAVQAIAAQAATRRDERAAAYEYGARMMESMEMLAPSFLAQIPFYARLWVAVVSCGSTTPGYEAQTQRCRDALIRVVTSSEVSEAWSWLKDHVPAEEWEDRAGSLLSALWECDWLLFQEEKDPLTRAERVEAEKDLRAAIGEVRRTLPRTSARCVASVLEEPLSVALFLLGRREPSKDWLLPAHVRDGRTRHLRDSARRDAFCRLVMQWIFDELGGRTDKPMVVKRHVAAIITTWTGIKTETLNVGRACPGGSPKSTTFSQKP